MLATKKRLGAHLLRPCASRTEDSSIVRYTVNPKKKHQRLAGEVSYPDAPVFHPLLVQVWSQPQQTVLRV